MLILYELLQLNKDADQKEIKDAYERDLINDETILELANLYK